MDLYRVFFIAFVAAAVFGAAPEARSQVRAVIHVSVDENGRTIVRCEGAECETVDCSGQAQLMTTNESYVISEEEGGSCVTGLASADLGDFLDQLQQEMTDILLGSDGPIPAAGGLGDGVDTGFLDNNEDNQGQNQDLGESSDESPITL